VEILWEAGRKPEDGEVPAAENLRKWAYDPSSKRPLCCGIDVRVLWKGCESRWSPCGQARDKLWKA